MIAYKLDIKRAILSRSLWEVKKILKAGVRNWKPPKKYDIEFPPGERRKLHFIERQPLHFGNQKPQKMQKHLIEMRGPEEVHNFLMHKQYGILALGAGRMRFGHFDAARLYINRRLDENRMFAIWRVDSPWKPVTKKGLGHRMGGGKGNIDHYVTPVKKGRIIIEMGGYCEFEEVEPMLRRVADKMPFKAMTVSQEILDNMKAEEKRLVEENMNPFNFEYCLKNNFMGSKKWASPYDYIWHNKYH